MMYRKALIGMATSVALLSQTFALNAYTANTPGKAQLWNTLRSQNLRLYGGRVQTDPIGWLDTYQTAYPSFDAMYARLPQRHRNAPAYMVGYGMILPIIMAERGQNTDSLLNQGLVLASQSTGLRDSGLDVFFGHSSSMVKTDFSASLLPLIAYGAVGSEFAVYVRQSDGSYFPKHYRMETVRENVRPADVSTINDYTKKSDDYVIFVTCKSGRQIASLKHRSLYIAKRIYTSTMKNSDFADLQRDDVYGPGLQKIRKILEPIPNTIRQKLMKYVENIMLNNYDKITPDQRKLLKYVLFVASK